MNEQTLGTNDDTVAITEACERQEMAQNFPRHDGERGLGLRHVSSQQNNDRLKGSVKGKDESKDGKLRLRGVQILKTCSKVKSHHIYNLDLRCYQNWEAENPPPPPPNI